MSRYKCLYSMICVLDETNSYILLKSQIYFFFTKTKLYSFIQIERLHHLTPLREITSFNTAKNAKDESTIKLTSSKLIAYNDILPTKIYDKLKVTRISMPPDLQCWRPNLWLNNRSFNMNQMNTAKIREIIQRRTRRWTTNHDT